MMIYVRKYMICVFLAFILLLQTIEAPSQGKHQSELIRIKLLVLPFLSYAPFFVAQEKQYFTEQGLQVEFVRLDRSASIVPALVQGELDVFAGAISFSLLNAMSRGARIQFVAEKGYIAPSGCAYGALMARRTLVDSGNLANPNQLRGKRIAVNPASTKGYFLEKILEKAGLTLHDIQINDITSDAVISDALAKGALDLGVVLEPWVTRILQSGQATLWTSMEQIIPNFQHVLIAYGPSLLDKNPDAGNRFMIANLKAVREYQQGKTEQNLEMIAKHTGLDRGLLKKACWPELRSDGKINIESVLDFQSWAVKEGFLDKVVPADQFWNPSFIEYANKVLSTTK